MKKILALAATVVLGGALLLSGCGSDKQADKAAAGSNSGKVVLKVGATPVPHAELLAQVKPILEKEGVDLQVVEFTDYNTPNLALNDKELDANFFQHVPYLEEFAKGHNLKLAAVGKVHVEPIGLYSKKVTDIKQLTDGAKIAIPNDPTNGGRALILLDKAGLLKLKDNKNIASTKADIVENPHNYQIVELEAAQLPRSFEDVDLATVNTNYALEAGLNPAKDALVLEDKESPYANIIAVRQGDENRPEIQKLVKALQSEEIKKFIAEKYKGAIVPAF